MNTNVVRARIRVRVRVRKLFFEWRTRLAYLFVLWYPTHPYK